MIKKCLLAAAVTAAALLCLTGCQPKKDPLQFGSTAVVLETDEAQNGFNGTEADLSLQAEAVPEVTAGRAASLEESDYKGFAGQIQKVFSERDIEALSRLCAYPVLRYDRSQHGGTGCCGRRSTGYRRRTISLQTPASRPSPEWIRKS